MVMTAALEGYPSVTALRSAHAELLRRAGENLAPPLLDEIEAFLGRAIVSGGLIDSENERWEAQGMIDYWAARLYRAGRMPVVTLLAEFDPSLAPELDEATAPYVGLRAFDSDTGRLFFGRERLIEDLVARLADERFIAVLGPSGSGKSSIVLGGLLPALAQGSLPGSATWRVVSLVPGSDPLGALARAVAPKGAAALRERMGTTPSALVAHLDDTGTEPAVLVVDQLEEIFTLCADEQSRDVFVANLLALAGASRTAYRAVVTMRSDFEDRLALLPDLQHTVERHQLRVTPLSAAELRRAIERPAALVGLKFADGVVDRLVREVLGEPAGLPLLQFTLSQLWALRQRNRVTMDAYHRVGGGRLALARSAENFYDRLIPEEQETMKRILLRMVQPGDGLEVTSRPVSVGALLATGEARDRVERVLDRLIAACLLKVRGPEDAPPDERQVELAHEALVRNWPTLVAWVEEARIGLRRRTRLTAAAEQWAVHHRDPGGLLGGTLLEEAKSYSDLSPVEQEFVAASQQEVDRIKEQAEAARRRELDLARERANDQAAIAMRWRQMGGALVVALLVALGALVYAFRLWAAESGLREAEEKAKLETTAHLGLSNLKEKTAQNALLVAQQQMQAAEQARKELEFKQAELEAKVASLETANLGLAAYRNALSQVSRQLETRDKSAYDVARAKVIPLSAQVQVRASATPLDSSAGTPQFRFSLWVTGPPDALKRIDRVHYEFNHPTFKDPVQVSDERASGFRVSYTGWGCLSSVLVTFATVDRNASSKQDFNMCAALSEVTAK